MCALSVVLRASPDMTVDECARLAFESRGEADSLCRLVVQLMLRAAVPWQALLGESLGTALHRPVCGMAAVCCCLAAVVP